MIVVCPNCTARFQYGEERFQGVIAKRFRCPKCDHVFEVMNPNPRPAAPPAPAPWFPEPPPTPQKPTETTARKDREAIRSIVGTEAGMPQGMRFSLAFLTGPHASTVRVLDQPSTVIGREEGDVIINDPETSRRHARLDIHPDGTVWLADMGSTNGTSLAGTPITEATQIMDRQEFSCGRSTFMLLIRTVDSMNPD